MAYTYSTSGSRKLYIPFYFLSLVIFFAAIFFVAQNTLPIIYLGGSIALIVLTIIFAEIHRAYDRYEINPRSVVHRRGFYHTHTRRIDLYAISDVIVTQTLYQKILNFGNIQVRLFSSESKSTLKNLDKPHWFAEMVESNMHTARGNMQNKWKNTQNDQQTPDQGALEDELNFKEKTSKRLSKQSKKDQERAKKSKKKSKENKDEDDAEIIERLQEL